MKPEESVLLGLEKVGNKNKYQYMVSVLLCFFFLMESYMLLGGTFYLMDPVFNCKGESDVVDEKEACHRLQQCTLSNDFTIVAYMGLYCDRQGQRDAIQSVLSIGSLLGLFVMNYLADLKGRKTAFIVNLISGLLGMLLTLIGAYAKSTTILILGSLLCGFCGYAGVIICYIIASDICEEQFRQKISLTMNLFFSFGAFTFFFMYNWCNQWYNILVLFMIIPMIGLTVVSVLLIQESPNYFLLKRKDKRKCIDVLTTIAIYNQTDNERIDEMKQIINKVNFDQGTTDGEEKKDLWATLKQWKYLKIILFMGITQSGANVFFYGIQFAVDDIGFNYGFDNLVMGITEMVMVVVMTGFVTKLKRKKTMFIVYPLTALVAFSFIIFGSNKYIATILILCIRALTSIGYFMVMMVQTESFPVEIQSIGAGSIEALAQIGSFASPLIIALAINMGWNKLATMGVVLVLCLIPLKFVPEPRKHGFSHEKDEQTLLNKTIQEN